MPPDWIDDNEILWRRVPPSEVELDGLGSPIRPKSSNFKQGSPPLSVNIASLSSKELTLAGYEDFFIAKFTAGQVREINCKVERAPLPENSAHAHVIGTHKSNEDGSLTGRLTGGEAKKLSKLSVLIL